MVSTRLSASARQRQVVEHVSLSLADIIVELFKHVPPVRCPQLDILLRLVREKPHESQLVKEHLLIIAGPDSMRAAVAALVGGKRKPAAADVVADELALPPLESTIASDEKPASQQPAKRPRLGSICAMDGAVSSSTYRSTSASSLPMPSSSFIYPDPRLSLYAAFGSAMGGSVMGNAYGPPKLGGASSVPRVERSSTVNALPPGTDAPEGTAGTVPLNAQVASALSRPLLPLPQMTRDNSLLSLNASGNLSLAEMLRTTSASDLAPFLGDFPMHASLSTSSLVAAPATAADGPPMAEVVEARLSKMPSFSRSDSLLCGLSLKRNKSAMRELNSSDLSISGFLDMPDKLPHEVVM